MRPSRFHLPALRTLKVLGLVLGLAALVAVVGLVVINGRAEAQASLDANLDRELSDQVSKLKASFQRSHDNVLLLAQDHVFADYFDAGRGSVAERRHEVNTSLFFLESLDRSDVGEACFIYKNGHELARVVDGREAPASELSTEEADAPFFAPTFALQPGQVHTTRPYLSPDTHDWVVANASRVPGTEAIVHFELRLGSLRADLYDSEDSFGADVIDARTGLTLFDRYSLQAGKRSEFAAVIDLGRRGIETVAGRRVAWFHIFGSETNANDLYVVVNAKPVGGGIGLVGMLLVGGLLLVLVGIAVAFARRWEHQQTEAKTDALTGLGNRRLLLDDLDGVLAAGTPAHFLLFDLDGFKDYNDGFGHQAGDTLLAALARRLADAAALHGGTTYRLGGDEFCVIVPATTHVSRDAVENACIQALRSSGDGFAVSATCGAVDAPEEASVPEEVIRLADQRMYAGKHGGRRSAGRQTTDVLLQAIEERNPDLQHHLIDVAELAERTGRALGLPADELDHLRRAAALHDVGKVAIPDEILNKPEALLSDEWEFVRAHPLVGERIISAAPALARAAKLVRATHERWDGTGYPDRLAGEDIPLASRVIAVCDAYDAMTGPRPYRLGMSREGAIAELRKCAGTQFDPVVVGAFLLVVGSDVAATPATPA